jgi:hypothetical protein
VASLRTLEPRVRGEAEEFTRLLAQWMKVVVTSARRDRAQQEKLYRDFVSGRSKFPAAPPGQSTHGAGTAFDLQLDGISPPKRGPYPWQYELAGLVWELMGYTWGGRFDDPIHFDFRPR